MVTLNHFTSKVNFMLKKLSILTKKFLIISENVKIKDVKGSMVADKLYFDIKEKLNIASFEDNKINANVNLK